MKAAVAMYAISTAAAYKAAYVEHNTVSPCGQGSCGHEQNAASVKAYDAYAKEAAAQGAQIIVFPEYGITGFSSYPKQSWESGGYAETVSGAVGKVPCDDASAFAAAPSVVSLSCTAKKYGIAMVANLMEYTADRKLYNTNVALDTDGTYLAKYHKRNLWGESNVDVPPVEHVTFKTSFGETFGMLVCADLIYQHPVLDLVASGVKNFVMPLAWSNEMSQMQALAYAQGWSLANGVNLILSNHHGTSESGSGMLVSGKPVSQYYAPGSGSGPVRVAEMQAPTDDLAMAPLHRFNATAMGSASWSFGAVGSKVCSGAICCEAAVSSGAPDGYVLAALDGTDTNSGMRWPAQVCAVLPCARAGESCLQFQQPTGSLKGVEISMSGASSISIVPEVLQSGGGGEVLLTPGKALAFQAAGSSATLTVAASAPLVSAIIYGRPADSAALAMLV